MQGWYHVVNWTVKLVYPLNLYGLYLSRSKNGGKFNMEKISQPPDRDIFLRKYYLLQSGKEIAAALGMSVESVNTRLSRGRDRLRRELTEKGVYSHA